jgi:indole-3-glycerol phosphate synthase
LNSGKTNILAEIKFKSPALGTLSKASTDQAIQIARTYLKSGAAALSILTEIDHFEGNPEYLIDVRAALPQARILMKDFMLEEYQLLEARIMGADCILLIVSLLGAEKIRSMLKYAQSLGLSALVEVHDPEELEIAKGLAGCLIGVNNRNLRTLEVSLTCSYELAKFLPKNRTVLSESGIQTREEIVKLQGLGYQGFLIGGTLMQATNPSQALETLMGIRK